MGNVWAKCCEREDDHPVRYGDQASSKDTQPLLTSALRTPGTLPALHSRRKENKRTVRIESLSPIMVEVDEYETESDSSHLHDALLPVPLASSPISGLPDATKATTLSPNTSPKHSSGLRLLLNAAAAVTGSELPVIHYENEIERKEDEELQNGHRGLRRVERLDSFHTVLTRDDDDVMFAQAPVAAMKHSELPKGLVFAFLDDCPVSRATFAQSLKITLEASEDSIVRGATIDEARGFVTEALNRKPDFIVLDNCLDYETPNGPESVRGMDLAREIRARGFDGCIVVQSEQDSLRQEVDFEVVDGITGKQKAPGAFAMARMVAIARRKHKANPHSMPSSRNSSWNSRGESSFSFDVEEREIRKCLEDGSEGQLPRHS